MDDIRRPKKRSPLKVTDTAVQPIRQTDPLLDIEETAPKKARAKIGGEPAFVPPEEVEADTDIMSAAKVEEEEEEAKPSKKEPVLLAAKNKRIKNHRIDLHMPHGKKQWALTILVILLLLGGAGSAYWFGVRGVMAGSASDTIGGKSEKPKPTTEVSKLSGLTVPIGTNLIPVTSVMIENSPDARPQAGLKEASVVFEAIAEGGITRFNTLFQDTAPEYVGPVRSVRPYYLDWLWPFDASVAHVGGAPQALADIKSLGIKDLDQFYNAGAYDRITSRYAPHNVYTSIARLQDLEKKKGFVSADFTGFTRKKEAKLAVPTAKSINVAISGFYYDSHYDYDAATNTYLRSEGGAPHKDDKSGTQLAPKVVVAITMGRGTASDGQHTDYQTTGSGHMYVFQDGGVTEGTWIKEGRQKQWVFKTLDGSGTLSFNPGQTWFTMVDANSDVTFTP